MAFSAFFAHNSGYHDFQNDSRNRKEESNMNKFWVMLLLVLNGFVISGCASIGPEKSLFGGGRVTTASANQLFDPGFEEVTDEQLVQLLDPSSEPLNFEKLSNSEKIAKLREAFIKANANNKAIALRSQIQDRLIAASNQRCNLYTTYLKRVTTYENGIFGTLTTIFGGAGAIVTGETAARTLSGLAGISSGTRAELTQATFESIATSVIIPGIQKTRDAFLEKIMKKRTQCIAQYTIEGAIADVITYHGYCSMDTGISFANKSIQAYDETGMIHLIEIMKKIDAARNQPAPVQ